MTTEELQKWCEENGFYRFAEKDYRNSPVGDIQLLAEHTNGQIFRRSWIIGDPLEERKEFKNSLERYLKNP